MLACIALIAIGVGTVVAEDWNTPQRSRTLGTAAKAGVFLGAAAWYVSGLLRGRRRRRPLVYWGAAFTLALVAYATFVFALDAYRGGQLGRACGWVGFSLGCGACAVALGYSLFRGRARREFLQPDSAL
ncbi:MAG: hypothetical protein HZA52_15760 [Planctomycetes bacterium]|nr:hypothetical protein [Planctomycetota bacterium]